LALRFFKRALEGLFAFVIATARTKLLNSRLPGRAACGTKPESRKWGAPMTEAQKAWLDANPMFEICDRGHHVRGYLLADGTIGPAGPASRDAIAIGVRMPCAVTRAIRPTFRRSITYEGSALSTICSTLRPGRSLERECVWRS
jgi:hypothetical protein